MRIEFDKFIIQSQNEARQDGNECEEIILKKYKLVNKINKEGD